MMEQEIVDYILQAQKHGLSDYEIKQNLLNVGWEAASVEDSLVYAKAAENRAAASSSPSKSFGFSPLPQAQTQLPASEAVPQKPVFMEPAHLNVGMTDQAFQKPAGQGMQFFKKPVVWVSVLVIAILGGGGFFAYAKFFAATPDKVINKYLTSKKEKTFKTNYSISYSDKTAASTTGEIGLSIGGDLSSDFTDVNKVKQQNDIKLALTYGITNFGVNFKYLLFGKVIYFDIGQIPQLKSFLPDQNIQWIKIDLDELKQQKDQNTASQAFDQLSFSPQLQSQLKDIWAKATVLKTGNFFAKEDLNGVAVYHLKENFDNGVFSKAVTDSIEAISKNSTSTSDSFTADDKKMVQAIINKEQVKEFDVWIGQSDSEIYKFHLLLSAPTIKDFSDPSFLSVTPGIGSAQAKSRDAKRLADVRQSASALELYNNDFGGYPEAINGTPKNMTPTYIGLFPTAPTPSDGTCTDYYNSYWYSPSGDAKIINGKKVFPSYTLTFCLGADVGGYKAGIAKLTPEGIKDNIACPSTPDQCVNNSGPADNSSQILAAVNKMTFGAELKIDATYSDYGKPQSINAPQSSTDILDLFKGAQGASQDAKRVADIRMLASALELYFNDKNSYPSSLKELSPTYISVVPTAPTPASGNCSEAENTYTYKQIKSDQYQLSFCLGSKVAGFEAGTHNLTQAGIQ